MQIELKAAFSMQEYCFFEALKLVHNLPVHFTDIWKHQDEVDQKLHALCPCHMSITEWRFTLDSLRRQRITLWQQDIVNHNESLWNKLIVASFSGAPFKDELFEWFEKRKLKSKPEPTREELWKQLAWYTRHRTSSHIGDSRYSACSSVSAARLAEQYPSDHWIHSRHGYHDEHGYSQRKDDSGFKH